MHDEQQNMPPVVDVTRRGFVVTSLAAGFAMAAQPVSDNTITTDTKGLEAGEVKIPAPDGEIPAYRALPAEGGSFPVVLVVQEIFGVHEHIKDICRRFAKLGYLAVAPELYARQGDVSKIKEIPEIFTKVVSKVPDKQVMSDLDAAVAWAKGTGKGDVAKLAITGFCWGGRIVWLYAAHNENLKAGVAWYGGLVKTPRATELQPKLSDRLGRRAQGTGSRPVRSSGPGHPGRFGRANARGPQRRQQAIGDYSLPGYPARVLRRLPAELSQG